MAINYRRSFGLKGPAWSLLALIREDKVGKKVHIVPNGTDWQVKPEGSSIPTSTHRTQQAATDAGTPCSVGTHPAARGLSPVSCLGWTPSDVGIASQKRGDCPRVLSYLAYLGALPKRPRGSCTITRGDARRIKTTLTCDKYFLLRGCFAIAFVQS
jgi:hypothetical protein